MDPINPVSAVASALSVPGPGGASPPTEAAVKKFEALMARSEATVPTQHVGPAETSGADAVNPVGRALSAQEAALRDVSQKINDFTVAAPNLSLNEMVSQSIALGHTLAQATTALTCTTAIGQGANKGLQSLLKNQ
jgi:type III secretion inner rod protein HrpB2